MGIHLLTRKTHYWSAIIIALPVVVILTTGILLQVKKQVTWVQPPEQKGRGERPQISFEQILGFGLWPFIVGGIIKAGLAALIIPGAWALVRSADKRKAA